MVLLLAGMCCSLRMQIGHDAGLARTTLRAARNQLRKLWGRAAVLCTCDVSRHLGSFDLGRTKYRDETLVFGVLGGKNVGTFSTNPTVRSSVNPYLIVALDPNVRERSVQHGRYEVVADTLHLFRHSAEENSESVVEQQRRFNATARATRQSVRRKHRIH